jgi:hypothetical protein
MKRLLGGFAAAVLLAVGAIVAQPTPVAAQNPTTSCQACRIAFTTCMQKSRTPQAAAVCRAAAVMCLQTCTGS